MFTLLSLLRYLPAHLKYYLCCLLWGVYTSFSNISATFCVIPQLSPLNYVLIIFCIAANASMLLLLLMWHTLKHSRCRHVDTLFLQLQFVELHIIFFFYYLAHNCCRNNNILACICCALNYNWDIKLCCLCVFGAKTFLNTRNRLSTVNA